MILDDNDVDEFLNKNSEIHSLAMGGLRDDSPQVGQRLISLHVNELKRHKDASSDDEITSLSIVKRRRRM